MDKRLVDLLLDNYDAVFSSVKEKQALARAYYEQQFAAIDTAYPANP